MKNSYTINEDGSVKVNVKKKDGRELTFEVCKDGFERIKNINRSFCIKEQHGKQIYVYYSERNSQGKVIQPTLHRLLMNEPENMVVDHRDRNPMNNKLDNLRICTHEDNSKNRGVNSNTTAIFKGVFRSTNKNEETWYVKVKEERVNTFINLIAAANCYNYHVKILDGEFAVLNDVEFMEEDKWKSFLVKTTSSQKGVHYDSTKNKWVAQITFNKKQNYIGSFKTEKEAIEEYKKRELELLK